MISAFESAPTIAAPTITAPITYYARPCEMSELFSLAKLFSLVTIRLSKRLCSVNTGVFEKEKNEDMGGRTGET